MKSSPSLKRIPLMDLKAQHDGLAAEINRAIKSVFAEGQFILGPATQRFEEEFADHLGAKFCAGVASGTDALQIALRALEIGPGDEVIVPALTFAASAFAVAHAGARPVFVDVDEKTCNIDPAKIKAAITKKTKAIMPVHLYGQPARMGEILFIAREHGLYVVEDACQAHGALFHGKRAGTTGDVGCFSFYPSKNLGACGDGGAIVTSNPEIHEKVKILRHCGQKIRYRHEKLGFASRLDSLQAAILSVKLPHLENWNAKRRELAAHYSKLLKDLPLVLPQEAAGAVSVYHLYVVRTPARKNLSDALAAQGIETAVHYDMPLHLQACFRPLGYKAGDFPVAEKIAQRALSLPMYPELPKADATRVVEAIARFLKA